MSATQVTEPSVIESDTHPHEPAIEPILDNEGRCLVCSFMVMRDKLDYVYEFAQKMTAIFEALGNNPMASMMLGGLDLSGKPE